MIWYDMIWDIIIVMYYIPIVISPRFLVPDEFRPQDRPACEWNPPRSWYSEACAVAAMAAISGGPKKNGIAQFDRIGLWENLQETPIFDGKNHGFL